jgi:hypothetical protein
MKIRTQAAVLSIGCFLSMVCAAQTVKFNLQPQPGRTVEIHSEDSSKMVLNLTGDSELIEKNRALGVTFPLQVETRRRNLQEMVTSAKNKDESFSVRLNFLERSTESIDKNGNVLPIRDAQSEFVGANINAEVGADGVFRFISIEGKNIRPELKSVLPQLMDGFSSSNKSLEGKQVSIGESISEDFTLDMPMPKLQPINLSATTTYTLISVNDGIAQFQTKTKFTLGKNPETVQIEASGSSTGTMEYDVKKQLMTILSSVTSMKLKMIAGELQLESDVVMQQTMTQSLKN